MRKITLLLSAVLIGMAAHAQITASFDDLPLPTADTYYVNASNYGADVGFPDGLAHFPCIYDTSGGFLLWNYFSYSNMTDSVTSGYTNQYSAKAGSGYSGSAKYAVAYCADPVTFQNTMVLPFTGPGLGNVVPGFYVTNNTYTYNCIRDGDFDAKKFGGTSGNDPDWFLLTIKGYRGGMLTSDSVNFYLADYRFAHNDSDYIVRNWTWVDLLSLGSVDSLQFQLTSSDNGSFGMNTPAYFCMDNLIIGAEGVKNAIAATAKIYPNPAVNMLFVDFSDNSVNSIAVQDMSGRTISEYAVSQQHMAINTASLPAGTYLLRLYGDGKTATTKFVKQ